MVTYSCLIEKAPLIKFLTLFIRIASKFHFLFASLFEKTYEFFLSHALTKL